MSTYKMQRLAQIRQKELSATILDKERFDAVDNAVTNLLELLIDYTPSSNITWRAHVCNVRNILNNTIIILDNIK